jgi:transmembrane sensor
MLRKADWADDELVAALRQAVAQRDAARQVEPTAAQSDRMWAAIEEEIEPAPTPTVSWAARLKSAWRALVRPPARRWVAAALVLVGLMAAWFFVAPSGPERVARAEAEIQTYVTPGSTTVQLRPHSTLYRVPGDTVVAYRLDGEAYFAVASGRDRPFEVVTDEARVRVLGTRFNVRSWGAGTEVFLDEGTVQLSGRTSAARSAQTPVVRRLAPGQQATAFADGRVSRPASARRLTQVGWLRQTLVLDQRPLREVVAELEQHYAIQVTIPGRLADQTLSGRVALDDRAQSLRDLAVVLGGRFDRVSERTYRFVDAPEPSSPEEQ